MIPQFKINIITFRKHISSLILAAMWYIVVDRSSDGWSRGWLLVATESAGKVATPGQLFRCSRVRPQLLQSLSIDGRPHVSIIGPLSPLFLHVVDQEDAGSDQQENHNNNRDDDCCNNARRKALGHSRSCRRSRSGPLCLTCCLTGRLASCLSGQSSRGRRCCRRL